MMTDDPLAQAQEFAASPARFFGGSWYAMQHVAPERLAALQLNAIRARFAELRHQIPMLTTLADGFGVDGIRELDDAVPLLCQHTVYKSYPAALLERGRFDHLTRWLARLTSRDISSVHADHCDSIDAWLDLLDAQTDLRIAHSSGTAGTMSFLPRAIDDWERMYEAMRCGLFQFSDPRSAHEGEHFELVWPLQRSGRSAITRLPEMALRPLLGGREDRLHALHNGRLSADVMWVAARLRAAMARGDNDDSWLRPTLRGRCEEFERERRELSEALPRFIDQKVHQLRGRRIWMLATWNVLYEIANSGLENGLEGVFAPDSLITTGGGAKGQTVPDDWEDIVKRFVGVDRLQHGYGMTEMTALNKLCEAQHYHFEPWIVPFILHSEDGTPLPRTGVQTGRLAFFDVLPTSYWGGFVTGDEVTAHWTPCGCGKTTAHIERHIERFSDKHGDDKITCAATDEAHAEALDVLTGGTV